MGADRAFRASTSNLDASIRLAGSIIMRAFCLRLDGFVLRRLSASTRPVSGEVFHTHSCYARGTEMLNGAFKCSDEREVAESVDHLELIQLSLLLR